jgi:hypothetical protein
VFFFLVEFLRAKQFIELHGNWSHPFAISGNTTREEHASFVVQIPGEAYLLGNLTLFRAIVKFTNSTNIRCFSLWETFLGIAVLPDGFFFFRVSPRQSDEFEQHLQHALIESQSRTGAGPARFAEIDAFLRDMLANETTTYQMNTFGFYVVPAANLTEPFALHHVINGSMIHSSKNFTIIGYVFDAVKYLNEARLYGVITAFSVVLTYVGWRSILRNVRSDMNVSGLSVRR